MDIENSFPTLCPGTSSSDGLVVDCQPNAVQFERISKEPNLLSIEKQAVSIGFNPNSRDPSSLSQLAFVDSRRELLNNRRIMLLKIKHIRNKNKGTEDLSRTPSVSEESESTELEDVEQELFYLVEREKELLQILKDQNVGTDLEYHPPSDQQKRISGQGVYILPPCKSQQAMLGCASESDMPSAQSTSVPPEDVVDVENLRKVSTFVKCPFCKQVVRTNTYRKIGEAAWILCFVSSLFGCVAGCCLLPFILDNLKDIYHSCPECHKIIYTIERM